MSSWLSIASAVAVVQLIVWFLDVAFRSIIGEYAKRIWFSKVHRDAILKAKAELDLAQKALDRERSEFDNSKFKTQNLIGKLNTVFADKIKLQRELQDCLNERK